jgi:hypothetical protein
MSKQTSIYKKKLEVPYVLDSQGKILCAKKQNLLNFPEEEFDEMLAFASDHKIIVPPILEKTKNVKKEFRIVKNIKTTELNIKVSDITGIDLINGFDLIMEQLPYIRKLSKHESILGYIETLPNDIADLCLNEENSSFEVILDYIKLIKKEILLLARTKRTGKLEISKLKEMIIAYSLFLPENEHILSAVRQDGKEKKKEILFQNVVSSLLFYKSKKTMRILTALDYETIKNKLFSKLAKVGLTSREKMSVFNSASKIKDPVAFIEAVGSFVKKVRVEKEKTKKIEDYILSLKDSLKRVNDLDQVLFMTKELKVIKKVLGPECNNMGMTKSYKEQVIKSVTQVSSIGYYPCKDYLDLAKCWMSDDCTHDNLARKQLLSPEFFNIRLFGQRGKWKGNIYMLDFTNKDPSFLIIDRIQVPRQSKADYINLFANLKEVLTEMFLEVSFKYIVCPVTISNHKSIQKLWHNYRKKRKLPFISLKFKTGSTKHFESLRGGRKYHVFTSKEKPGEKALFENL